MQMGTVSGKRRRTGKVGYEVLQSSNPIDIPVPLERYKSGELTMVQSESSQKDGILPNT